MTKEEDDVAGYTYIARMNTVDEYQSLYYIKSFGILLTLFNNHQIKYPFKSPTTVFLWAINNCTKFDLTKLLQLLLFDYRVDPSVFGDYPLQTVISKYDECKQHVKAVVKLLLADVRVDPNAVIDSVLHTSDYLTSLIYTDERTDLLFDDYTVL